MKATDNIRQHVTIILRSGKAVEFTCDSFALVPGANGIRSWEADGADAYGSPCPLFIAVEQVDAVMVQNVVVDGDGDGGEQ